MEQIQKEKGELRKLRSGFTTGTCAAVAVRAAVKGLFVSKIPEVCEIMTPAGVMAHMEIKDRYQAKGYARCGVIKDAGDDPDVTNGTWVGAAVYIKDTEEINFEQKKMQVMQHGYEEQDQSLWIGILGGDGIGRVTKKGLSCPLDHAAINPVPRKMIFQAAKDSLKECKGTKDRQGRKWDNTNIAENSTKENRMELILEIMIPKGKELADQTFNPHLGIEGGISVLGSSGVVEPMSEAALQATIDLELHMQAVQGERFIILTPGNYGERFIQEDLGLTLEQSVKCSNFIGDSIKKAAEEGFLGVLLIGHIGKCIKVSLGVMNTHSKYGDRRTEGFLCALDAVKNEIESEQYQYVRKQIESANTSEEAVEYLKKAGVLKRVMQEVMERIQKECLAVCGNTVQIEAVTFSSQMGLLGKTAGADAMADRIRMRGVKL